VYAHALICRETYSIAHSRTRVPDRTYQVWPSIIGMDQLTKCVRACLNDSGAIKCVLHLQLFENGLNCQLNIIAMWAPIVVENLRYLTSIMELKASSANLSSPSIKI
jgi:hypothetical protein